MTGIEFTKRLPCGEVSFIFTCFSPSVSLYSILQFSQVERARRAIRVFILMRRLSLSVSGEVENQLPLVRVQQCIKISDVLDLSELFEIYFFSKGLFQ